MRQRYLLCFLLLSLSLVMAGLPGHAQHNAPIEFIRNDGQWDGPFNYKAATTKGDVFLSGNSFTYVVGHPANRGRMDGVHHGQVKGPAKLGFHAYRMTFEGAAEKPEIKSTKEQTWYYNYFLGNDQRKWKSSIHPALALDYSEVYPGINLHVASEKENLKYEWLIAPGAAAANIRMRIDGADALSVRGGNLIIKTSVGEVQELKPVAYQYADAGRKAVRCSYHLRGNLLTYDLPDDWDKTLPLIIDPTVVFSTLTGATADNWGYTATYDAQGNFYAGGIMLSYGLGGSYPTTTGAFQVTYAGGVTDPNAATTDDHGVGYASDIAIMKLNATGTMRLWATYIGGATDNEQPHSLIVDAANNLVIAGVSYSTDYPVTSGCYDNTLNGGADIIVTKLNAAGTALIGSTYIGGTAADGVNYNGSEYLFGNLKHNYGDNARSEVIVDKANNVYVTASTKSTDFPVTANAYQGTFGGGGQDAVVIKLNPALTALTYSTYLGGSSDDAGYVLALDTAQTHLYVGGGTQSPNFPATGGTWKATYQGGAADGYIARFGNGGAYPLQKICYVATANEDQVYGVQVDGENSVYAMGQSLGGAFPVTPGVYSNPASSQFVIKMDSLLATDIYSTVYGSGDPAHTNISPVAFLVDTCQNVYISGWGGSIGFPQEPASVGSTTGMPVTPAMLNSTNSPPLKATTDGADFYFIVFSKNAISLLFGAFLGATATTPDHVDGGTSRFDKSGVIYQGICANCSAPAGAFPTTSGSWATSVGSSNCNEAAVKIAFNLGAVDAIAAANPIARGCPPLTVHFGNTSTNATAYSWNFMDGSAPDTAATPIHTFITPGIYNVRLVAFNPNACKVRDTTYVAITVDSNRVKSAFTVAVLDSCGPFRAAFTNTSQYGTTPGSQGFTQFTWLFGDGASYTGATPPVHSYPAAGTYTITLIMRDTTACNNPDTSRKIITFSNNFVKAAFTAPVVCAGKPVAFTNSSTNYTTLLWRFGDGATSTLPAPVHTYGATGGTFTVTLIAANPASCNKKDSVAQPVTVKSLPVAAFTFSPTVPVSNTPIQFSNGSVNATDYEWTFGDGAGSVDKDPQHLYRHTGHFTVCLVAKNGSGCNDTLCKGVDADVSTAADIPTAFSPNGDGANDVLYVRGGAIEKMNLKIFNRWGQLVFESNSLEQGWDGAYGGKPQEMDAYAFVLNVTFIDGTAFMKKGNVTLLR